MGQSPARLTARPCISSSAAHAGTKSASMPTAGPAATPTPESLAERATEVIEAGFTALKFDPIPGRWRTYVSKDVEDAAVENVRAVREAVGPPMWTS